MVLVNQSAHASDLRCFKHLYFTFSVVLVIDLIVLLRYNTVHASLLKWYLEANLQLVHASDGFSL